MSPNSPLVRVHVNIELPAACIEAVVANTKKKAVSKPQEGHRLEPADALSALISAFLQQNGFDEFVRDVHNY
jgi:hypothetical protein